jgi:23S rRNA (guanine2445-N2)-methyltransferase / 23S rRNA (guanine2069-N7)-methyltransferase
MEAEYKRLARRLIGTPLPERFAREGAHTLVLPADQDTAWVAANYLRTPSRVLLDLYRSTANRLEPLYEDLRRQIAQAPSAWLHPGFRFSVEVRKQGDFPAGPLQVRGAVKNAILAAAEASGLNAVLDSDHPELLFAVEPGLSETRIALDLVGHSMHQRGYRTEVGEAPLKETLAAQMLMLARYRPQDEILLDPMCGTGALPIEAALMAQGAPLFSGSSSALLHKMPCFRDRPLPLAFPGAHPKIFGSDVDESALRSLRQNARRADVDGLIHRQVMAIESFAPARMLEALGLDATSDETPGLILTNPPYGMRLNPREDREDRDGGALQALYRALGELPSRLGAHWRLGILTPDPDLLPNRLGDPTLRKTMYNGGIACQFLVFRGGETSPSSWKANKQRRRRSET